MPITFPIYLELGKDQKRIFAGALDWPGWCRSGRDEESAVQALLDYGPRYAKVLKSARLGFKVPTNISVFKIKERLQGNAATDFGAPNLHPSQDDKKLPATEFKRQLAILKACWRTLETVAEAATGKELRTGPRGGGRDLEKLFAHVSDADRGGYLSSLGWKARPEDYADPNARWKAIVAGLTASVNGEIPATGPRGGQRWTARYFIRRAAWHILDHAWELEDRIV